LSAIITLTTDFGTRDAYVAEMKGVMLEIAAAAGRPVHLVDVTHEVERHDVTEAALALDAAAPHFPPGTVHLAVVDPGVGTERRELVVQTERAVFVGPDNGVFTPFLDGSAAWRAWELRAPEYRLPSVSRTFHGRDIFAPAAAYLATGVAPDRFGPPVMDPLRLSWPTVRAVAGAVAGAVLHVDRFGNLVTSIRAETLDGLGGAAGSGGCADRLERTARDRRPGGKRRRGIQGAPRHPGGRQSVFGAGAAAGFGSADAAGAEGAVVLLLSVALSPLPAAEDAVDFSASLAFLRASDG
jgi:S-adenosylmethionine hydrolase